MPHHKSAKKRLLTSKVRRQRNRANRSQLRTEVRSFSQQVSAGGDFDQSAQLSRLYRLLDVQARKGVIHKNKASRLKSRLASLIEK